MSTPTNIIKTIEQSMRSMAPSSKTQLSKKQQSSKSEVKTTENNITTSEIQQALQAVNKDLEQTENAYRVQKDTTQQYANQFSLLNPLESNANENETKKENEKNSEKINVDELLLQDADTLRKSIDVLKKNPELMEEYLRKKQQLQLNEKRAEEERVYQERVKREQQAVEIIRQTHPDYVPKPLTKDFNIKIKQEIKNREFTAERRKANIIRKSLEVTNEACIIQKQMEDRENRKFEEHQRNVLKDESRQPESILPLTYIQERNQLLSLVKLSSLLTLLRNTSSVFSEINSSNKRIEHSCIIIQQYMRMFNKRNVFERQLHTILKCEIAGKIFLNKRRQQERVQSLLSIKSMLFSEYNKQTFLGSVGIFKRSIRDVLITMLKCKEKKLVRETVLLKCLEEADEENAYQYAKNLSHQRQLLEENARGRGRARKPVTMDDIVVTEEEVERQKLFSNTILASQISELMYERLFELKENVILDEYSADIKFQNVDECCFAVDADLCNQIIAKIHSLSEPDPKKERVVESYIVEGEWPAHDEFRFFLEELNFD